MDQHQLATSTEGLLPAEILICTLVLAQPNPAIPATCRALKDIVSCPRVRFAWTLRIIVTSPISKDPVSPRADTCCTYCNSFTHACTLCTHWPIRSRQVYGPLHIPKEYFQVLRCMLFPSRLPANGQPAPTSLWRCTPRSGIEAIPNVNSSLGTLQQISNQGMEKPFAMHEMATESQRNLSTMDSFGEHRHVPTLPIELAEAVLVTCIRSVRCIRSADIATKHAPYLCVAPHTVVPEVTKAAIARQVYVDLDNFSACGNQRLLSLAWRMAQDPQYSQLVLMYTNKAVDVASARGHVSVLEWWKSHANPDSFPIKYSTNALDHASASGQVAVLEWWKDSGLTLKYSILAIRHAAKEGHADVLSFWLKQGRLNPTGGNTLDGFLDLVGETGKMDALEWWLAHRDAITQEWTECPFTPFLADKAFTSGMIHVLDWAIEHALEPVDECLSEYFAPDCIDWVIERNHENSLQWLVDRKVFIECNNGIEAAVFHKRDKDLGQWLLDTGISQVSLHVLVDAFAKGDLDYVKWCYKRANARTLYLITEADMAHMFLKASYGGSVDLLDWIVLHLNCDPTQLSCRSFPTMLVDCHVCSKIEDCFAIASDAGHVAVLDWFAAHGFPRLAPQLALHCVRAATSHGHPQVLHWMSSDKDRSSMSQWATAYDAVAHPADMLVEALPTLMHGGGVDPKNIEQVLGVMRWYWEHFRSSFGDVRDKAPCAISHSAALLDWWTKVVEPFYPMKGAVSLDSIEAADVLKWWLTSGRGSDYHYTTAAMDQASSTGRLELLDCWRQCAQMNGNKTPENASMLEYSSAAMDNASRNGHLDVLDWWVSSGIRPLKYSSRAFKFSPVVPEHRRAEIVRWWLSSGLP